MLWGIGCGAAAGVHRMWWGGFRIHRPLVWKACEMSVVGFGVGACVAWCVRCCSAAPRPLPLAHTTRTTLTPFCFAPSLF